MKIDFITFCHPGDIRRLYANTWLVDMVASHNFQFDTVRIVHQRCAELDIPQSSDNIISSTLFSKLSCNNLHIIPSESLPNIFVEFGYPDEDLVADQFTHGPTAPHYWRWHNLNHLIGLKVSDADYIVFSDSDCTIKSHDPGQNWIRTGVDILQRYPEVLIVSPGDGGTMLEAQTPEGYRLTQNVSQQLFLCSRKRLKSIDFNIPWNWEFLAPGGPFQEYYYLLEGRMWRYMHKNDLWRCILPDYVARYWHWNKLTEDGFFVADENLY